MLKTLIKLEYFKECYVTYNSSNLTSSCTHANVELPTMHGNRDVTPVVRSAQFNRFLYLYVGSVSATTTITHTRKLSLFSIIVTVNLNIFTQKFED